MKHGAEKHNRVLKHDKTTKHGETTNHDKITKHGGATKHNETMKHNEIMKHGRIKTQKSEEVGPSYNLALFCKRMRNFFMKLLLKEALKEPLRGCHPN